MIDYFVQKFILETLEKLLNGEVGEKQTMLGLLMFMD
tara:strand:- start:124 stop:234 length:111 start_codon:yes stop_codon:yes gene_type:complete